MIREATAADADAVAALQLRAWWRAYADYVDPERFGTSEERVERWRELLAQPEGLAGRAQLARLRSTLVFDQDGLLAGFASVGPARDADASPTTGELKAVYVDPVAQGAGVGGALLDAAESRLREDGYVDAVLWVFTENAMARAIYGRRGWVLEPADVVQAQHGSDWWAPAVRCRRAL